MKNLTREELKRNLKYFPKTGKFKWKIRNSNRIQIGDSAGYLTPEGYNKIRVNNQLYKSSRLAFLYMYGYFPEHDVDHINRIRNDDRWKNLRHVSRTCNNHNRTPQKNKSGITGVSKSTLVESWQVGVWKNNNKIYIGSYRNFDDAVLARWKAEIKYNYSNCCSTSLAYLYLKKHNLLEGE